MTETAKSTLSTFSLVVIAVCVVIALFVGWDINL